MIRVMLCVLIVGIVWPETARAQDAKAGAKVFAEQNCSVCHSIGGKGNAKGALDGVAGKLSPDEIRQWIVAPKEMTEKTKAIRQPVMKKFDLRKRDVDSLVAYLQTLTKH